ncbi:MAG: hypothetical protein QM498_01840 [Desulfobacterium sp.]
MADTIRENIISAYTTRLATMTTINGYVVGAGDCNPDEAGVYRATPEVDPDDIPACVVWPGIEEAVKDYGEHECAMKMKVEAMAPIGTTNPSIIQERILGDLKKCLFDMTVIIHADIEGIVYIGGGVSQTPSEEDTIAAAYVEFTVKYNEIVGDPYTN